MTTNESFDTAWVRIAKERAERAVELTAAMRGEDIHRRLNAENIDLRARLDLSQKAKSAAQELLKAERQKNAELTAALNTERQIGTLRQSESIDLQRRLREAEGQLKAQRQSYATGYQSATKWILADYADTLIAKAKEEAEAKVAEAVALIVHKNAEIEALHHTIHMIAGLAGDPAKEPKP